MSEAQAVDTGSWRAYQESMEAIRVLRQEINIQNSEVWFRNELCLGSPGYPWVRAPLERAADNSIPQAIGHVRQLVGRVLQGLASAISVSKDGDGDLKKKGIDVAHVPKLSARTDQLVQLWTALNQARDGAPFEYHPALLARWLEILETSIVEGDAAVRVVVTTEYIL